MEINTPTFGGRVVAVAVAAGALATTAGVVNGWGSVDQPLNAMATNMDLAAKIAGSTAAPQAQQQTVHVIKPGLEAAKLMRAQQLDAGQHVDQALRFAQDGYNARQAEIQRKADADAAEKARVADENAKIAAQEAAKRPAVVKPAEGTFTSGFGGRWGTTHYGVDIANAIGTPIVSAMDGVVIEAGPASGFGLWVRVQHTDGTITIYGHVNEIIANTGTQVKAGDLIATIGNRGESTGPHLHFEVWVNGSQKIDPQAWLAERGITL
ncbi:M23 family metallopeptidase [Umezawaea sp. Da 62-37]|uniref:M23 family metallopeptidase n=1 Tax=Umezawaea sp. Da 62-37 TaxID=3075927 RepID=UPI0028F6D02F|nr:M23 family metallopeptidase [Umezawaea sp. Da 62-37]WNV84318.1 M23 family metallopeptidase [Umezawaea sp. Da 62-37]